MTDPFIDHVAELAGQTKKTLEQLANELDEAGLQAQAAILRVIAGQHKKLAHDCLTTTQPIDIVRHDMTARLSKSIEEIEEISAELLTRGRSGHSELSEAAGLLKRALDRQPK